MSEPRPQGTAAAGGGLRTRRVQAETSGQTVVPPIVQEVLQSPGERLDTASRAFFEPRFGHDFSQVKIHAGARAAEAASAVAARAFTVGRDIVFGGGEYAPQTEVGRRLLSHELTHTLQQYGLSGRSCLQKTPCLDERGAGPFKVAVIGSPGPGEIKASHPYQFMNAALFKGVDRQTVWIVEKTGYEAGKVDTGRIETSADPGCLIWLTPKNPLPNILSQEFPNASIASTTVYSHGIPGLVALRYGWENQGLENYGLSLAQVRSFSGTKFTPDATLEFNSCNTGTAVGEGNLAQETAYYTGRKVRAWTGRTSYAEVNDGSSDQDTEVHGSEVYRNRLDLSEMSSRLKGRKPVLTTFSPAKTRVGGFSSSFEIIARLPETRHFDVPAGGMVVVTCSNGRYERPDRDPVESDRIGIRLHRSGDFFDAGYESLQVNVTDIAIFRGLEAGDHYLEITAESAPVEPYETLTSDIKVDVYEA